MSLLSRKVGNLVECKVFAVLNMMFCGEMFREIVCVVIFTGSHCTAMVRSLILSQSQKNRMSMNFDLLGFM